jgi:hypothetical protein
VVSNASVAGLATFSATWVGWRVAVALAAMHEPYDVADGAIRSSGISVRLVAGRAENITHPRSPSELRTTPFLFPPPDFLLTRDGRSISLLRQGTSVLQSHLLGYAPAGVPVLHIAADERLPFALFAAQVFARVDASNATLVSLIGLPTERIDYRGLWAFRALVEPEYLEANTFRLRATSSISEITTERHDCSFVSGCDETWWLGVLPDGDRASLLVMHAGPHESLTVLDAVQVPFPREDSPESERVRTNTILSIWKQDRDVCGNNPVVIAPEVATTLAQVGNAISALRDCHAEIALTTRAPLEQALAAWQAAPNDHIHFSVVDIRPTPTLSRDQIEKTISKARMGLIACYMDQAPAGPSRVSIEVLLPGVPGGTWRQAAAGPPGVSRAQEDPVLSPRQSEHGSVNTCYGNAILRSFRSSLLFQEPLFSTTITVAFK